MAGAHTYKHSISRPYNVVLPEFDIRGGRWRPKLPKGGTVEQDFCGANFPRKMRSHGARLAGGTQSGKMENVAFGCREKQRGRSTK